MGIIYIPMVHLWFQRSITRLLKAIDTYILNYTTLSGFAAISTQTVLGTERSGKQYLMTVVKCFLLTGRIGKQNVRFTPQKISLW